MVAGNNTEIGKSLVDAGNASYEAVNTINDAKQEVNQELQKRLAAFRFAHPRIKWLKSNNARQNFS
jgi:hypothetical protein